MKRLEFRYLGCRYKKVAKGLQSKNDSKRELNDVNNFAIVTGKWWV